MVKYLQQTALNKFKGHEWDIEHRGDGCTVARSPSFHKNIYTTRDQVNALQTWFEEQGLIEKKDKKDKKDKNAKLSPGEYRVVEGPMSTSSGEIQVRDIELHIDDFRHLARRFSDKGWFTSGERDDTKPRGNVR